MILTIINNIASASNILQTASFLASRLDKKNGVMTYNPHIKKEEIVLYLEKTNNSCDCIYVSQSNESELSTFCEIHEVSFLFIQLAESSRKIIQRYLYVCRDLRIPYLFYKDVFQSCLFRKVLVPVGFLIEEYEKAQFATAFGRFCDAHIALLQANDFGTKAATTVRKISALLEKFHLPFSIIKASSDSFKVDNEAIELAMNENFDVLIVTASRDYGLDDLIFGPNELKLIKKTNVPLLLVNPREDLYVLCD